MKLINIPSLILTGMLSATSALASINTGTTNSNNILSNEKKCATAINSYLRYRYETTMVNAYKIQTLEEQVDNKCVGYQIKLVDNNGVMTGIVEIAD